MGKLVFGMMQSLDGYVAGVARGPQLPPHARVPRVSGNVEVDHPHPPLLPRPCAVQSAVIALARLREAGITANV
jgi:hypothetical protein